MLIVTNILQIKESKEWIKWIRNMIQVISFLGGFKYNILKKKDEEKINPSLKKLLLKEQN